MWDVSKSPGDLITSSDWNTMVTDQKGRVVGTSVNEAIADTSANLPAAGTSGRIFFETDTGRVLYDNGSSWIEVGLSESQISLANLSSNAHSELSSISTDDHHIRFGEDASDDVVDIPNRDVEDLTTQGSSQTVPVSQGDGTLSMQEISGGLERVSDTEGLVSYKQSFNSIRNRATWIEHVFSSEEDMADEITSSQVLMHYVFEAENDAYDRFIDPNHNLGLFAYNNDSEPVLSSLYEASMFLAPTSFLEGLMTIQSVADSISSSELLMDAVMTGDNILENQFGKEVNA